MALRAGHGNGAGVPRVETLPADEQPVGVPAPTRRVPRRKGGQLTPEGARLLGRLGGEASARARTLRTGLADTCGMLTCGAELAPYAKEASAWAAAQIRWMSAWVGGGVISPGVSSIVHSAGLALAASRYLYAKASETGDPDLLAKASRLADRSRQGLLTSHEIATREAKAREASGADDGDLATWIQAATEPQKGSS